MTVREFQRDGPLSKKLLISAVLIGLIAAALRVYRMAYSGDPSAQWLMFAVFLATMVFNLGTSMVIRREKSTSQKR